MRFYPDYRDNAPLRYVGRVPIYVTTILTALYVAGLLLTSLLMAAKYPPFGLEFSSELFFRHGYLWQVFTYSFVNGPDIYFLLWIYVFYRCGVDIEQFFGRKTFLKYYALLIATVPVVLGLWRLLGVGGVNSTMSAVTMGFFIGYATLYPDLQWFGIIAMKYVAGAFVAIMALAALASTAWQDLTLLLATSAVGFGFIRYVKLGGSVEFGDWTQKLNPFRRRPKFRVVPNSGQPAPKADSGRASPASVDAILDKIARDGFASLTQEERDQLERAREILNKKRH